MKKPIVLRIYKNEQLLGVKQFLVPQIVIGRAGPDTEVQVGLEGESVSHIHASLEERTEGAYSVSDLGSVGGTLKNGQPILDGPIDSGDVLQVGDYKIEFFIGAPKPKAVATGAAGGLPLAPESTGPGQVPPASTPMPSSTNATPPPKIDTPPVISPPPAGAGPSATSSTPPLPPKPTPPAATPFSLKPPGPPPPLPSLTPKTPSANSSSGPTASVTPIMPPPVSSPSSGLTPPPNQPTPPYPPVRRDGGATGPVVTMGGIGAAMVGPKSRGGVSPAGRKSHGGRKRKTFAPPSKYTDAREFVKPSKGTVVEVLVVWRERVISNLHFSQAKTVTIGSHPDNDIAIPLLNSKVRKQPILKIDKQAIVLISNEMRGEVVRGQTSSSFTELMRQNRLAKAGNGYTLALDQGEMAKIELSDQVAVLIRYVSDSPKPVVAPLLDLTAAETTGVLLALALVITLWIYMQLHSPARELPSDANEPIRTALIVLTPPTPVPLPPPPPPEPAKPAATPPPTPPPAVQKVKVAEKTVQANKSKPTAQNLTKKQDPGKSANAAPKNKTGPRTLTSPKQGGSIKTAQKEASQMQSKPAKDVSKSGIFSVFGNQGQQDQLAQGTTGSGELAGMANAATGKTGSATDRAGKGLGSELKDTGAGGNGKALEGIAGGLGTTGRGAGQTGYGTGGLGKRQGTMITPGGTGEVISGTIDREAIRRVILANIKTIRACYERELNRKPDLFGKLVLSWDIGEQGRVVGTRVKSNELGSKAVADCILANLKTWRFPEPPTNQVVEIEAYPFLFSN